MQELIYIVSYTNVSGPKSDYLKLLTLLPDGTISTFNYFNSAPLEESFYSYKVKKNGDFLK